MRSLRINPQLVSRSEEPPTLPLAFPTVEPDEATYRFALTSTESDASSNRKFWVDIFGGTILFGALDGRETVMASLDRVPKLSTTRVNSLTDAIILVN